MNGNKFESPFFSFPFFFFDLLLMVLLFQRMQLNKLDFAW